MCWKNGRRNPSQSAWFTVYSLNWWNVGEWKLEQCFHNRGCDGGDTTESLPLQTGESSSPPHASGLWVSSCWRVTCDLCLDKETCEFLHLHHLVIKRMSGRSENVPESIPEWALIDFACALCFFFFNISVCVHIKQRFKGVTEPG